jgi:hypothetical protein
VFVTTLAALLLAACGPLPIALPEEFQDPPAIVETGATPVVPLGVTTENPCPSLYAQPCADGTGCLPANGTVISDGPPFRAPTFSWTYVCNPDGYHFELQCSDPARCADPVLSEDLTAYDPSIYGPARSFDPGITLQPGYYRWWVKAFQSGLFSSPSGSVSSYGFYVGNLCDGVGDLVAPVLVDPWNDAQINTGVTAPKVRFSWKLPDDPFAACLPDDFNGQVSEDPTFTVKVQNIVTLPGLVNSGESEYELFRCVTYYWRVRGMLNEEGGPWSETRSFRLLPSGGGTCPPVTVMPKVNLTCRVGPSPAYAKIAFLSAGEVHPADGINAAGTHIRLAELFCYVPKELVDLGPEEVIPGVDLVKLLSVVPDPPLPTATPTKEPPSLTCSANLPSAVCIANGWTYNYQLKSCNCP